MPDAIPQNQGQSTPAAGAVVPVGSTPQPETQAAQPQTQPAAASGTSGEAITTAGGKVLPLSQQTINRMRQEEREKGKRSALRELDKEAQAMGFKDHADLRAAAARMKGRAAPPTGAAATSEEPADADATAPNKRPAPVSADRSALKWEKQVAQLTEEKRRLNKAVAAGTKRTLELQRNLDAEQAANQLRLVAVREGVHDVDYALELLTRAYRGKTEKELASFDELKFFKEDLRKSHPFLYGIVAEPAGQRVEAAKDGNPAGTPVPGKKEIVAPNGKSLRERMLSGEIKADEYTRLMRERGLVDPQFGSTYG